MEIFGDTLNPYRQNKVQNALRGSRSHHTITHNPSSANPKETLYVRIPKLKKDMLFVPGSMYLSANLEIKGDSKNHPVDNVGRNLISKMVVKIGGEIVYDLSGYNIFMTYKDLWMTTNQRKNRIYEGIQSEKLRKLRHGVDVTDKTNEETILATQLYKNKYKIPLDLEILTKHAPLYNYALHSDIIIEITLSDIYDVIVSENIATAKYKLENICLEYDTIENSQLANSVESLYNQGYVFMYDFVQLFKTFHLYDTTMVFNENINIPKKSIKGILLLFYNDSKFKNGFIDKMEITIEGISNKIFSQHMRYVDHFDEAKKYFLEESRKDEEQTDMTLTDYHTGDKYALWIDLRSTDFNNLHNSGYKLQNTKDGIQLHMTRVNTNQNCFMYVVSDCLVGIQNKQIVSFQQ